MAIKDFDFLSPGVQIREVDKSALEAVNEDPGLVIIGRARRGPGMVPVKVRSKSKLLEIFGQPIANNLGGSDIWRNGNLNGSTYGLYAAKAWVEKQGSPVTFVRLLGHDTPAADRGDPYVEAGWNLGGASVNTNVGHNVSAYGLFVYPSASVTTNYTGSLAAIFYMTGAAITLTGTMAGTGSTQSVTSAAGVFIESEGAAHQFKLQVWSAPGTVAQTFTINLAGDSNPFIRDVVNCNPQKLYSSNYSSTDSYFLGESFQESYVRRVSSFNNTAGGQYGIILALEGASTTENFVNHIAEAKAAKTGWVFSRNPQPVSDRTKPLEEMTKLFRIHSLHEGESIGKNYFIQIKIQSMGDNNAPAKFQIDVVKNSDGSVMESWGNLTLVPDHPNYIAKAIGTAELTWDNSDKVFQSKGFWPNNSDWIRVEIASALEESAVTNTLVPWGFYGPARPTGFTIMSDENNELSDGRIYPLGAILSSSAAKTDGFVKSGASIAIHSGKAKRFLGGTDLETSDMRLFTGSFAFPRLKLTEQNTKGAGNYEKSDALGVRQFADGATYVENQIYNQGADIGEDYKDLVSYTAAYDKTTGPSSNSKLEHSFVFSLDDVKRQAGTTDRWYWASGSSKETDEADRSYTAKSGSDNNNSTNPGYFQTGPVKFNLPLVGGFDGVDITHVDPFSSKNVLDNYTTVGSSYAFNSVSKAIDFLANDEQINMDVVSIPGLTNSTLVQKLINTVEKRGDSLAVVDYDDDYLEKWENNGVVDSTNGTVNQVLSDAIAADYNSSYAAAYFPRVRIKDGSEFVAPASLGGIGAIISSDSAVGSGPWFAPAGFNRGGLNDSMGVVNTFRVLTKDNRDRLYVKHINPIANFASIGNGTVVAFGQKTLLVRNETSALSRINVRRLLIYLKNKIGLIANSILFEPSVETTFNNFSSRAQRELELAKTGFGITEYKIVLDQSRTAEAIDRNIMYVQIYIKPARAIEFIAIDFVISKTSDEF